ncbi:IS630 family transposase [Vibrio rarus]|uniref:IS630 family transposase n=1 Tax=Vibrio rarus TaxID=413403 RepID=UPI0021C2B954|nr:IS630 family transposase [Vibrio rarus]
MNHDFQRLINATSNARLRVRYLAISHFIDGKNRTEIALYLKVSRVSVNKWVKAYLDDGLEGLQEKPHSGRPHRLTEEQRLQLKNHVTDHAINASGGRLQAKDIGLYIESNFGIKYQQSGVYRLLHEIGLSWITTRSKHPKQSIEAQEAFKKFQIETILKIPGHIHLKEVLVWFQDEARFGQRNTTTKIWAEKGTRPRAVQQQQFEYAYLFGAVCINTGEAEAIVSPLSNMEVMTKHLELISTATPTGKHSVVIMDQASWHQTYLANHFKNITIIHIPPYSPELNPIEQVWQWLRQYKLANRCFENYNDIVNSVCSAWNSFCEDKRRVQSLCFRDWTQLIN